MKLSHPVLQQLFDCIDDAIIFTNQQGVIQLLNPFASSYFGYNQEALVGQSIKTLIPNYPEAQQSLTTTPINSPLKLQAKHKNGNILDISLTAFPIKNEEGQWMIATLIKDIGVYRLLENAKEHDVLTGLPNFFKFKDVLRNMITDHRETPFSILLCGIDNFRLINEIQGSLTADQFLIHATNCLKGLLKPHEYLARKGGDEFILITPTHSLSILSQKAKQILRCFSSTFQTKQHLIKSSVSIGVSRYPDDADNVEELLAHADRVLKHAKETGKSSYQIFSSKKTKQARYLNQLQADLSQALMRQEFLLYYQPQVDVHTQEIFGAEAMLRWKHPKFGMIKPSVFIPLMENSHLIIEVGEWILQQACFQAQSWQALKPGLKIAVNISVKQLTTRHPYHTKQLASNIQKALQKSNLAPQLLELEITEGFMIHEDAHTQKNIKKLQALGVNIACDDFGTAYSSFDRIKKLPLSTIKIDRSLIEGLLKKTIDKTIIEAIISIGKQLNIQIVAEGVGTSEQISELLHLGCQRMQGYYFSKPISPQSFTKHLKRGFLNLRKKPLDF